MGETVHIQGLAELKRKLAQLPERLERNVMKQMVGAGAAVIRDQARDNAPIYHGDVSRGHPPPGSLRKAIFSKYIPEQSRGGRTVFYVGVRHGKDRQRVGKKETNRDVYYWYFVEFGSVHNPGDGHPFLRPAFDSRKEDAVQVMKEVGATRLSDEVARL
jgi:HK97 gp10 family phage protein